MSSPLNRAHGASPWTPRSFTNYYDPRLDSGVLSTCIPLDCFVIACRTEQRSRVFDRLVDSLFFLIKDPFPLADSNRFESGARLRPALHPPTTSTRAIFPPLVLGLGRTNSIFGFGV